MKNGCCQPAVRWMVLFCASLAASSAYGLDLTVESIEVNQSVQFGATPLIADKPTMIRATIGLNGEGADVAGVDGLLHIFVDEVEILGSPVYSENGPITAPQFFDGLNENHTLNFVFLGPESDNVDFVVEVNPPGPGQLVETDPDDNTLTVSDIAFQCLDMTEMIYIPVDYQYEGDGAPGLPDPEFTKPGIGDGFLRGIYPNPNWNYHISPTPPIVWEENIDSSESALLNELSTMREFTIPGLGYPEAPFMYGWLPGNPCGCNGIAISVPGDVAFGNTQDIRYQRTLAHEVGHLFGLSHTSAQSGTIGIDIEHHLHDTEDLPRLHAADQNDIMVAGALTDSAWVRQLAYNTFLNDSRVQCPGPPAGGGAPVLLVTGSIELATRIVQLDPAVEVTGGGISASMSDADLAVHAVANGPQGRETIGRVLINSESAADKCSSNHERHEKTSISVRLPLQNAPTGSRVDRIEVQELSTGHLLAVLERSPNKPAGRLIGLNPGDKLIGQVTLTWQAQDADGDALTYFVQYSPDGGNRWLPLVVRHHETSFTFDTSHVPAGKPGEGVIRLTVSDGMNTDVTEVTGLFVGAGSPPNVNLISPNRNTNHWRGAPVFLNVAVWDLEDQLIADHDIEWTSDLDGVVGHGRLLTVNTLSVGLHELTATATDDDGMSASDSTVIAVVERVLPTIDCNDNGVDDMVDIAMGTSDDCNENGIPDDCEPDCNDNGVADSCDTADGTSLDCNFNNLPDECEPDCNETGQPDDCDVQDGTSLDCNGNISPDECDIESGISPDCNANDVPDECDIESGSSPDCNNNNVPDECDIAAETSPDCNGNDVPDECDVASGTSPDCNVNGIPDSCDVLSGESGDCNRDMMPDECGLPMFEEHFDGDTGWTVETDASLENGAWERVDPEQTVQSGQIAQPEDCYPGGESNLCFVTEGAAGVTASTNDVDGGPTRLISPIIDLSEGAASISYAYWYFNNDDGTSANDEIVVEASNDGGNEWTQLIVHNESANVWRTQTIPLEGLIKPTAMMRFRFTIDDTPNNSVCEGLIDEFTVRVPVECPKGCVFANGDGDADGDVDLVDFADFQLCFTGALVDPPAGGDEACLCTYDFDADSDVDLVDFANFQLAFTGPGGP